MRRRTMFWLPAATLALAVPLLAGGFYLQLGNPEANPQAHKMNAVLVIKATGCHDPANATLTGKAVGLVNGERREIALKVDKLAGPGEFAITQQWPKEGRWVIELMGREPVGNGNEMFTNTLVPAGPEGIDRLHAKFNMKQFAPADVEGMLNP